jgi:hypothetical protein
MHNDLDGSWRAGNPFHLGYNIQGWQIANQRDFESAHEGLTG